MFSWKIVGHTEHQRYLQQNIDRNKHAHAYLFCGPEHVGKTTLAQLYAKSIFCTGETKPCNNCDDCRQFEKEIHSNVHMQGTDAPAIGVKDIRVHIKKLSQSTSTHQILLVPDAHRMTLGASNALLKTLEEPASNTIIVLITHKIKSLPQTIASRCQTITFGIITRDEMSTALQAQGMSQEKATELARSVHGKIGLALLSLKTEDNSLFSDDVDFFLQLLSSPIIDKIKLLQDTLFNAKKTPSDSRRLTEVLQLWQNLYRDVLLQKIGLQESVTFTSQQEKTADIAKKKDLSHITNLLENIQRSIVLLETTNCNPRLLFENLIINF